MKTQKQTLSKRVRFEIFKRDAFTCQYCGSQPPDVVLEVDHIHPRALGGDNEELNLLTACDKCNRGKGAVELKQVPRRPDADLKWLQSQQEIAEAKRYLSSKAELDSLRSAILENLRYAWGEHTNLRCPSDTIFSNWLQTFGPEEIEDAIIRGAAAHERGVRISTSMENFVFGILWKRKKQAEEGVA